MLKKQTIITQVNSIQGIPKFAAKIEHLAPLNPDFRYIRFRAIGNLEVDGPNQNWDAFPYEELADETPNFGWKTFIGKRAHVEHNSYSVENAIGELLDAYFNSFVFPEKFATKKWHDLDSKARLEVIGTANQNDGSVEVLMAVDTKLAPKIARMIDSGMKLSCSMGTNIQYSDCSVCGNRAAVEQEYCSHIARQKGQTILCGCEDIRKLVKEGKLREEWLPYVLPRQYDREAALGDHCRTVLARVFEVNYGLNFFELSVVGNPAYPRAHMLERVASKKESNVDRIKKFYGGLEKKAGSVDGDWLEFKPFKKEPDWGLVGTYSWERYEKTAYVLLNVYDNVDKEIIAIVYETEIPDEGDEDPEIYYRSEVGDNTIDEIYNTLSPLSKEQILNHPLLQHEANTRTMFLSEKDLKPFRVKTEKDWEKLFQGTTEEQQKAYEQMSTQDKKLFKRKMKGKGLDLGEMGIKGSNSQLQKIAAFYSGQKHECQCGGSCGCKTKVAAELDEFLEDDSDKLSESISWWIQAWYPDKAQAIVSKYLYEITRKAIQEGIASDELQGSENDTSVKSLRRIIDRMTRKHSRASLADLPRQDPEQKEVLVQKFMQLATDETQKKVLQEVARNSKLFITPEGELGHVADVDNDYPGPEVRFI